MSFSRKSLFLRPALYFSILFLAVGVFSPAARSGVSDNLSVYVIAIDGLRADKLPSVPTPVIDGLIDAGAYWPEAEAVIPTATRVNFVTFPTGVYAQRHGVVGSSYRDRNYRFHRTDRPSFAEAAEEIPVPTIFEALEAEGVKTGFLAMKGYELVGGRGAAVQVEIRDYVPDSVWENRYEREIDGSEERSFHSMLSLNLAMAAKMAEAVEEQGLRFFIANLATTDYVGHQFGPDSLYYDLAVMQADRLVGEFLELLERLGKRESSVIVIVADHGFTQVLNPENVIRSPRGEPDIPELAEAGIVHSIFGRGGMAVSLHLRDPGRAGEALEILRRVPWVAKIYTEHPLEGRDGTLSEINFNHPERSGDFYLDIDPNYTHAFPSRGQHGSTADSDRLVPLVFSGPGVKPGLVLEGGGNVDVAPTVAAIFGLDPDEVLDADGSALTEALVQTGTLVPAP